MKPIENMIRDAEQAKPASPKVLLLGLSFLVASNLMFLNAFIPDGLEYALVPGSEFFHIAELLAFLLGGMVCALVYYAGFCRTAKQPRWHRLIAFSSVFYLVGIVSMGLHGVVATLTIPYAILCGAPIGMANALLAILWGRAYRAAAPKTILLHAGLSHAIGITLSVLPWLVFGNPSQQWLWIIYQALATIAAARLLATAKPQAAPRRESASPQKSANGAAAYLWSALAGLSVFALVLGFYWEHYSFAVFYDPTLQTVVTVLAGAAFAAIACSKKEILGFNNVYKAAIPLAAALLLADPFLSYMESGMELLSGISWAACLMIFETIAWTALSVLASMHPSLSDKLFAIERMLVSGAMSAGIVLGRLVSSQTADLIFTALIFVFLAFIILSFVFSSVNGKNGAVESAPDAIQTRALQIAKEHDLSNRETEVFQLLVQGRGENVIGSHLFISPNTVKTHRKHIYKKLGVDSREKLLDLVQEYPEA